MSNQVYSSDNTKYYDFPGYNRYSIPAPQTIDGQVTLTVPFTVEEVVNDASILTVEVDGFVVNRPGMYTLNVNLFISSSGGGASGWEYYTQLLLVRDGVTTALSRIQNNYIPLVASPQPIVRCCLSNSIYLKAGDVIKCTVFNPLAAISTDLILDVNNTYIIISKLY